jgi:hypothetical protein
MLLTKYLMEKLKPPNFKIEGLILENGENKGIKTIIKP